MDDLSFALTLADRADEITMRHFRRDGLDVRTKPDLSVVTEADLETERALRSLVGEHRPDDGVLGEEFDERPGGDRRWIIDPIDHTNNYSRGIEVFATLIALEEAGRITVGVVSAPALGRRWWAARGQGAYTIDAARPKGGGDRGVRDGSGRAPGEGQGGGGTGDVAGRPGTPIRVSAVDDLADAHLTYAALDRWERLGLVPAIIGLCAATRYQFGSGCFWGQMLVAEGRCDVSLDPWGKLWDNAAIQVIVEEAGGRFTDLAGEPRIDRDCAIVTNGVLHDAVLARLVG